MDKSFTAESCNITDFFDNELDIAIENLRNKAGFDTTPVKKEPTFWETDIEVINECSVAPSNVDVILFPAAKAKIDALMGKYTKMEWLAYLIGDKEKLIITDIVIPKQKVTCVNVFVEGGVSESIIGVIHSHHDMGNNFSHTDDEYINANHDISLCVSNNGINGQIRTPTECGRYVLSNINVIDWNGNVDIDTFLSDVDSLIEIKSITRAKTTVLEPKYNTISLEYKEIELMVDRYMALTKDIELSHEGFAFYDKVEVGFLISLLRSINTDDFYDVEDIMYNNELYIEFSEECVALVDEIDIFHSRLTNKDYQVIKKLLVYLEDISKDWDMDDENN